MTRLVKKHTDKSFEIKRDEPIMTSGVVSRLLNIPVWVLKQLDREQVVRPSRKRRADSRLYSQNEVHQLKRIWYYMSVRKVNVHGVKVVLELEKKFGMEV